MKTKDEAWREWWNFWGKLLVSQFPPIHPYELMREAFAAGRASVNIEVTEEVEKKQSSKGHAPNVGDITGGLPSEEYVARNRDDE